MKIISRVIITVLLAAVIGGLWLALNRAEKEYGGVFVSSAQGGSGWTFI